MRSVRCRRRNRSRASSPRASPRATASPKTQKDIPATPRPRALAHRRCEGGSALQRSGGADAAAAAVTAGGASDASCGGDVPSRAPQIHAIVLATRHGALKCIGKNERGLHAKAQGDRELFGSFESLAPPWRRPTSVRPRASEEHVRGRARVLRVLAGRVRRRRGARAAAVREGRSDLGRYPEARARSRRGPSSTAPRSCRKRLSRSSTATWTSSSSTCARTSPGARRRSWPVASCGARAPRRVRRRANGGADVAAPDAASSVICATACPTRTAGCCRRRAQGGEGAAHGAGAAAAARRSRRARATCPRASARPRSTMSSRRCARLARARRTHARPRTLRDGARAEASWAAEVAAEVGALDAAEPTARALPRWRVRASGAPRPPPPPRACGSCARAQPRPRGERADGRRNGRRARAARPRQPIAQIEQATRRAQAYLVIDYSFNFG